MNRDQVIQQLDELSKNEINPHAQQALRLAAAELRRTARHVRPWNEDVRDFQLRFGHFVSSRPTLPDRDVMALRQRLINEEFKELYQALESRDLPEIARESVDLVYVVLGTMESCGLEFRPFWDTIHAANMLKMPNPERNGKTLKPPGWVKPDLASMIGGEVLDLDPIETLRLQPRKL
jgi:predicted HAD superfamily Cof-like phosphohydrolase